MKWEVGTLIGEQVRLARPLGGGGSVWVADQLDWKKQVAIKFVTQGLPLNDLDALVSFIETAAEAAAVECPRLVQTFDHGLTDDGVPYVLMELLEGQSLDQRLLRGRLKPVEAGAVVAQVAEVLHCVHEASLVHAGIDPGNIFLCDGPEQPSVSVLNLGVAAARAPRRTSNYISPEQYMLKPVDSRSDLWSLAAVAYEMLTGEPPVSSKQRRNLKWEFTPPSEMWLSDIPAGIDQWFVRALSKRSQDRFESVRDMAREFIGLMPGIEQTLGGEPELDGAPLKERIGAHKVIEVGTTETEQPEEEPPESEPEAVSIEVDD
jgi:serine/threonine-protein kinase